jgi:DNA-binding NarL/FixJ family response regulator
VVALGYNFLDDEYIIKALNIGAKGYLLKQTQMVIFIKTNKSIGGCIIIVIFRFEF